MQGEHLRLVLIGKTGSGKSASGNTILNQEVFESCFSGSSVTKTCVPGVNDLCKEDNGQRVVVVDTPGFGDTHLSQDEVHTELTKCVALSAPGPHAFLLVVALGRYTEDEDRAVDQLAQIFGEEAIRHHTLVLFTRGDDLNGTVEEFIRTSPPGLHALIDRCGGRYHVFNNKNAPDSVQVKELIGKVAEMVKQTATGFYTNEMYKIAAAAIKEQQKIQGQLGSSSGQNKGLNWQSWLDAALSPEVLAIIRTMLVGLATGAAIGVSAGVALPIAAACGNNLVRNLTAGAVAGAAMGLHVAAQADNPSEAALKTVERVVKVGVSALRKAAEEAAVSGVGVDTPATYQTNGDASGPGAGTTKKRVLE